MVFLKVWNVHFKSIIFTPIIVKNSTDFMHKSQSILVIKWWIVINFTSNSPLSPAGITMSPNKRNKLYFHIIFRYRRLIQISKKIIKNHNWHINRSIHIQGKTIKTIKQSLSRASWRRPYWQTSQTHRKDIIWTWLDNQRTDWHCFKRIV